MTTSTTAAEKEAFFSFKSEDRAARKKNFPFFVKIHTADARAIWKKRLRASYSYPTAKSEKNHEKFYVRLFKRRLERYTPMRLKNTLFDQNKPIGTSAFY